MAETEKRDVTSCTDDLLRDLMPVFHKQELSSVY